MPYSIYPRLILRSPNFHYHHLKSEDVIKLSENQGFREALYLASPQLTEQVFKNTNNKTEFEIPLYKYVSRASNRCTPYGLFAGCSCVDWGNKSEIIFEDSKRTTRLDFEFVYALIDFLNQQKDISEHLKYYPNNTIYASGDYLRYIEYTLKKGKRHYKLSQVEKMPELDVILQLARRGVDVNELASVLTGKEIPSEDAKDFIFDLIENKLLLSELEPSVTSKDYLSGLIQRLSSFRESQEINTVVDTLKKVRTLLKQLDEQQNNTSVGYQSILSNIKKLNIPFEDNKIFQVDLIKTTKANTLDNSIQNTLNKGIEALLHLAQKPVHTHLQEFSNAFIDRYEDKEIPILSALDSETGIGYPKALSGDISPLIEDIPLSPAGTNSIHISKEDKLYLEILQKAYLNGNYSVDIEEYIPKNSELPWELLPPSFHSMFKVTNFETNEIFIESVSGSSAVNLLGRFGHADRQINDLCASIALEEQANNKDVVIAEISHIPENRTGNVISHPPFRAFEIPILSPPDSKASSTIPLQDLLVSVRNKRIVLRSKKLNKEIIPRLSNAHNHSLSEVPVYRFLCDLQTQGSLLSLTFKWGAFAKDFFFLPRVYCGKAILKLATWQLPGKEWQHLLIRSEIHKPLKLFLTKWKIPMQVVIVEADNELFIDFNNEIAVKTFLHVIKNKEMLILREFLADRNSPITDNQKNCYANQFIAPFIKTQTTYKNSIARAVYKEKVQREFIPGSRWVYLKYYCGTSTADLLLTHMIKPLADKFLKDQHIDKWFFLRYRDSDTHLRVRFHLTDIRYISKILRTSEELAGKYVNQGLLWKVQTDTYKREIERYGENSIELSEQIFFYDSEAIMALLTSIEEFPDSDIRWLWAFRTIDEYLEAFELTLTEKFDLMQQLKESFVAEFNIDKKTRLQLDKKYRKFRSKIENFIQAGPSDDPQVQEMARTRIVHTDAIRKSIGEIVHLHKKGILAISLDKLIVSFIHMHINRLIPSAQRFHELVIYDYLYRYYRSKNARAKNV